MPGGAPQSPGTDHPPHTEPLPPDDANQQLLLNTHPPTSHLPLPLPARGCPTERPGGRGQEALLRTGPITLTASIFFLSEAGAGGRVGLTRGRRGVDSDLAKTPEETLGSFRASAPSNSVKRTVTGTTIKDTWTKSRGRVEVGEGGGSAGVGWRAGEKRHTTVIE